MIKTWKILFLMPISWAILAQPADYKAKATLLLSKMTLEEKIGQLNLLSSGWAVTGPVLSAGVEEKIAKGEVGGLFNMYTVEAVRKHQKLAVRKSRLHIPLIFGLDVIHGHRTIFPIPLAQSCSWDLELIKKSAQIAAKEASADGINWTFSPMVDIARDARWGRISEGSGEDPYLGSQIARAMVLGYQGDNLKENYNIMSCVKHFALYGAVEAGRDYNTVDMSRLNMYQYYFPPYKAAVEAGAASAMTSFNVVDELPSSGNKWLLTTLLRNEWGFDGFVVTDYTAINEMSEHGLGNLKEVSALALNAGTDMDMVGEGFYTTLKQSVQEGKVSENEIDKACLRILEAKYKLGLFDNPYKYIDKARAAKDILTPANRLAAREAATKSFVLLKNDNQTLPLKKRGKIALIGPLAENKKDIIGTWVVAGNANDAVSVVEGMKNAARDSASILYAKGANIVDDTFMLSRLNISGIEFVTIDKKTPDELLKQALEVAKEADVIVAVLGECQSMSGEAASRSNIGLPDSQLKLLKELKKLGKPLVLVLMNGRPMTLEWENQHCDAILETWASGTEGGNAIADVLFGKYNPAGKLTTTFPRNVGQIPLYYNHKNTGRPANANLNDKYKSKYLDIPNDPLYPFGFGLSFTQFDYSNFKLNAKELKGTQTLTASVTITNSGKYAGEEIVQLYIQDPVASISRAVKELKGFQKIQLKAGESKIVSFNITNEDLKFYNSDLKYDWESGEFKIQIGTNSDKVMTESVNWIK
ncbi:MAG: beta-glucosidase BglX [Cytophagales bacterium]